MSTMNSQNTKPEAARPWRTWHGAMRRIAGFIGRQQLTVLGDACYGEEGQYFIDMLNQLAEHIDAMPRTYEQDGLGDQAVAHLHYFTAGADWYITERDQEPEQLQAFGLADLGYGPELGYINLVELVRAGAELDLHWTPRTLGDIKGLEVVS